MLARLRSGDGGFGMQVGGQRDVHDVDVLARATAFRWSVSTSSQPQRC
ncbi:MAG: hypothetical protein R3F11_19945 [Verrucomicrobiales bacterium]